MDAWYGDRKDYGGRRRFWVDCIDLELFFQDVVLSLKLAADILRPTFSSFCHSFTLVSSRAFYVDAHHGLSMVPVADAFNHQVENHVHLESDYDVCPECGSLAECPHDAELPFSGTSLRLSAKESSSTMSSEAITYDMVANVPIAALTEIFNTYGETLSNAQLLVQYGFVLEGNDNDRVVLRESEVIHTLDRTIETRGSFLGQNQELCGANVIPPEDYMLEVFEEMVNDTDIPTGFWIDSDGKLSRALWSFLIKRIELQVAIVSVSTQSLVQVIGLCIIKLCDLRLRDLLSGDVDDIGEIFDSLPDDWSRTRLVMTVVMSERAILQSCKGLWISALGLGEDGVGEE